MTTLKISRRLMSALDLRALDAFPEECCGVLLGWRDSGSSEGASTVSSLWPAPNIYRGPRSRGYAIAPQELLRAYKAARESQQDVIGYYHSHPEGGAAPSSRDLAEAGSGVSYLIVAIRQGQVTERRSWRLRPDRSGFEEEPIV